MRHRPSRLMQIGVAGLALFALAADLAGCQSLPGIGGQPEVRCGRFEGPGCNGLVELGLNAVAVGRLDAPSVVAVAGACPDNARCLPSALGGEEAAVVVGWPDGTIGWVTIALPADWPAGAPGPPVAQAGPPPEHLQALVAPGG